MFRRYTVAVPVFLLFTLVVPQNIHSQNRQSVPPPDLRAEVARLADKSNPERLDALVSLLSEKNISTEIEPFTIASADVHDTEENEARGSGKNLVATVGGEGAIIAVGAHYDKVTVGSGVVDNGASAVILVELAEALKEKKLDHTVRIIWFDAEEMGLIGSRKYLQAHENDPIISYINLDVNAYGHTTVMGPSASTGMNRLYRLAKTICVEKDFNFVVFPRYGGGDDISFQRAGIENISIGVQTAQEAHEFWLSLNADAELKPGKEPKVLSNIHSENDSMNILDPAAMTQTYILVLEMIERLDKMP